MLIYKTLKDFYTFTSRREDVQTVPSHDPELLPLRTLLCPLLAFTLTTHHLRTGAPCWTEHSNHCLDFLHRTGWHVSNGKTLTEPELSKQVFWEMLNFSRLPSVEVALIVFILYPNCHFLSILLIVIPFISLVYSSVCYAEQDSR